MDWFKITMAVLGVANAVLFPVRVVRAARVGDRENVFELVLSAGLVGLIFWYVFWPEAVHAAGAAGRWLTFLVVALYVANRLGLGRWMFRPKTV